ncbi:PIN domain-containing protein [Nostoc sp.]|uniref:PIN domain-containing protein n=1 Tax=Nostoc sp. TaxID=1180 RepID=UPI002FF6E22D
MSPTETNCYHLTKSSFNGYLLDTCVISDFVKGEKNTLKLLKSTTPTDIFISSLTVMEVKYGLAINPQCALKIQLLIEALLG